MGNGVAYGMNRGVKRSAVARRISKLLGTHMSVFTSYEEIFSCSMPRPHFSRQLGPHFCVLHSVVAVNVCFKYLRFFAM